MLRAVKLSLEFATNIKIRQVRALLERYRSCVNHYIQAIWERGGTLDKKTQDLVACGHLTAQQRSHALKQALAIISATRASAKTTGKSATCPSFRGGMTISKLLAELQPAKSGQYDYWLRLSTLSPGNRISIPVKSTKVLNKWLSKPLAKLKGGCTITERNNELFAIVWVELPDLLPKQEGSQLGIDVGINKLLTLSDGQQLGEKTKEVCAKVRRRKPGSKGKRRAQEHRRHYFGEVINEIDFTQLQLVAIEDLKGIKTGKKRKRGKQFRKVVAPWTAASVLTRIESKAQENRVLCVEVDPRYTSQTCPKCSHRAMSNRSNEKFKCIQCGYTDDADHVGSLNILNRALGSLPSPNLATSEKK